MGSIRPRPNHSSAAFYILSSCIHPYSLSIKKRKEKETFKSHAIDRYSFLIIYLLLSVVELFFCAIKHAVALDVHFVVISMASHFQLLLTSFIAHLKREVHLALVILWMKWSQHLGGFFATSNEVGFSFFNLFFNSCIERKKKKEEEERGREN